VREGTINGEPYSLPDGYQPISIEEYTRLITFYNIIMDLDRNANGRHKGDADSGDPTGVSQGNLILPVGMQIGWTLGGYSIIVPPRGDRHKPEAWMQ